MASDIWLRTILIVRKKTHCRHIGYSFRLTARVLLYAPSHRQDSTYHSLCYTSHGALAGMRNSSMDSPHEGSIRRHRTMSERSYHGATSRSQVRERGGIITTTFTQKEHYHLVLSVITRVKHFAIEFAMFL